MENQRAPSAPRSLRQRNGGGGGGGGREDIWSEGATEILIKAWGDCYVKFNRGNLRQKDWKEIAGEVNGHRGSNRRKTDIQCKNRIDTLKKKYKLEKAKPAPSKWPFYYRLNSLIGTNAVALASNQKPNTNPKAVVHSRAYRSKPKLNSGGSTENSFGRDEDDVLGFDGSLGKHPMDSADFSGEMACRELARAILKFGEIYERIESSKQQQIMELEKQRMELTKDVELQRMNLYMEAQLELQRMKRTAGEILIF